MQEKKVHSISCVFHAQYIEQLMREAKLGPKQQKLVKKIQQQLSIQAIYRQLSLIPFMNRHLEFPLIALQKIDSLQSLTPSELVTLVEAIPFLKKKDSEMKVRIEYENGGRLLLVTGIQKEYVQTSLQQFNSPSRYGKGAGWSAKIHHSNSFWVCIETSSEEAANYLKKYLRNEKRNMDECNKKPLYKIDKRRVRIIIAKEDLFTLLVDSMTEAKAASFALNFSTSTNLEKKKSQQHTQQRSQLVYRPLPNPYSASGYSMRNETRQEQLSDGFSQSTSLNSDLFDPNKMKDIIETSDQGIQSQSLIHFKAEDPYRAGSVKEGLQEEKNYMEEETEERGAQDEDSTEVIQPKEQENKAKEQRHEQDVIKMSEILRIQNEEYGLCLDENKRQQAFLVKVDEKEKESELEKIPPTLDQQEVKIKQYQMSKKQQIKLNNVETKKENPLITEAKRAAELEKKQIRQPHNHRQEIIKNAFSDSPVQTEQGLYSVLSIGLMRRCLTEYKNRGHSEMVELPSWLKSQTENERNRHRFFSSLCRPKLIHRRRPF